MNCQGPLLGVMEKMRKLETNKRRDYEWRRESCDLSDSPPKKGGQERHLAETHLAGV